MNAPLSQLAGDPVAPKTPCRWRATTAAATDEPSPCGEAVVVVRGILTAAVRRLAFFKEHFVRIIDIVSVKSRTTPASHGPLDAIHLRLRLSVRVVQVFSQKRLLIFSE